MKKSFFAYAAIAIQAVLCVCFAALLLSALPRSWRLQETLHYILPQSTDNGTVPSQPIKSFVTSHPFYSSNINDSYITTALENLHVQILTSSENDSSMNFKDIKSGVNVFSYTVYNQSRHLDVFIYYPKASNPRIAVLSKETDT